jgi:hypothetical protein
MSAVGMAALVSTPVLAKQRAHNAQPGASFDEHHRGIAGRPGDRRRSGSRGQAHRGFWHYYSSSALRAVDHAGSISAAVRAASVDSAKRRSGNREPVGGRPRYQYDVLARNSVRRSNCSPTSPRGTAERRLTRRGHHVFYMEMAPRAMTAGRSVSTFCAMSSYPSAAPSIIALALASVALVVITRMFLARSRQCFGSSRTLRSCRIGFTFLSHCGWGLAFRRRNLGSPWLLPEGWPRPARTIRNADWGQRSSRRSASPRNPKSGARVAASSMARGNPRAASTATVTKAPGQPSCR